ncbi:hypothetical protein [Streptomyces sp. NPDC001083]|uniref:hypothetical protein n=1 Tax=Streptomyces sp. NPDC001083 TaxID=3364545 RepID=UPI0036B51172
MQWTATISTALGAFIGVASTLAADRVRWRRDVSERDRDGLRGIYAEFLDALNSARAVITEANRASGDDRGERIAAARNAIAGRGVYTKRYQLELTAPEPVVTQTVLTVNRLIAVREAVVNTTTDSPEYLAAYAEFRQARTTLLRVMRTSLNRK